MAYSNQTDKITQRELNTSLNDKIDTARNHVDDPVPHISEEEREKLNSLGAMGTATPSVNGLMSAEDKEKLDSIEKNANNYIHPKSGVEAGTYIRTKVNDTGHVIAADNPDTLDITVTNTTHFDGLSSDQFMKKGETILQGDPQAPTPDGSNLMSVVNVNYLKLHYVPLDGNCTITGPIVFNESLTLKKGASITGDTNITGNSSISGTLQGNRILAGQGTDGGYSFKNESGADTGIYSNSEGDLYFLINGNKTQFSELAKTSSVNSSISSLRTELKNEMSGNYVLKSDVSNTANHIPRYNSSGHLVLPSGIEIW